MLVACIAAITAVTFQRPLANIAFYQTCPLVCIQTGPKQM